MVPRTMFRKYVDTNRHIVKNKDNKARTNIGKNEHKAIIK